MPCLISIPKRKSLDEEIGSASAALVNSRGTIERYHVATNGNCKDTIKRLKASAKWRNELRVDSLDCTACLTSPTTHYLHLVGHTTEGNPVLYSNFKLPTFPRTEAGKKDVLAHMVMVFEGAIRSSPNPDTAQFVWLNDFYGFGLIDAANVSLPMTFISMMAAHYPERLKSLLILDAPSLISPLWNLCKPVIEPKTHRKIKFLGYDLDKIDSGSSKLATVLREEAKLDEEVISWLQEEMKAVRFFGSKKGPRPVYDTSLIRQCAKDKSLPPPATDATAATPSSHSHYGTMSLMKMLMEDPSCLSPLRERES